MPQQAKPVIVTVDDDALPTIHDVARQLGASGLKVAGVMPLTGVITGHFSGKDLAVLKGVPGVLSVEEELGVQLPPPDSEVQ